MTQHPFQSDAVAAKFASDPAAVQNRLLLLRALVFNTAANTPGVGPLQETLKWGEPAYLTALTGAGSTVRMDWKPKAPAQCALVFDLHSPLPLDALGFCIGAALTHHLPKRRAPQ